MTRIERSWAELDRVLDGPPAAKDSPMPPERAAAQAAHDEARRRYPTRRDDPWLTKQIADQHRAGFMAGAKWQREQQAASDNN